MSELTTKLRDIIKIDEAEVAKAGMAQHKTGASADAAYARAVRNENDRLLPLIEKLIEYLEMMEWVVPKLHQSFHKNDMKNCRMHSCEEYKKAFAALGDL